MTKQEKIDLWLRENCRFEHGLFSHFRIVYESGGQFFYNVSAMKGKRLIGIVDAEAKTFLACPDFTDDIEAPVALPKQERGKRFQPEKFVPDENRNVLMRFHTLAFTGFFASCGGWCIFTHRGALVSLEETSHTRGPFTWEEL